MIKLLLLFLLLPVLALSEVRPHETALSSPIGAFTHIRIEKIRVEPNPTVYYARFNPDTGAYRSGFAMSAGSLFELRADPDLAYVLQLLKIYEVDQKAAKGTDAVKTNRVKAVGKKPWKDLTLKELVPAWTEDGLDIAIKADVDGSAIKLKLTGYDKKAANPTMSGMLNELKTEADKR